MQQVDVKSAPDRFDIIYIEGPGDLVGSFRRWIIQEEVVTEISRTFSGQFFDFCKENKLKTYAISYHEEPKQERTEQFRVEHLPKLVLSTNGIFYRLSHILYGLRIVAIAIRYRPKYLTLTTGGTYWFVLAPLKLLGIKIVPQFHNCLWPTDFPPKGLNKRILLILEGWFFRRIASASLCCSPELERQIKAIAGTPCGPIFQFRAQFHPNKFENPPTPVPHDAKPFKIAFSGRVERNKGVFDILEMAEQLRNEGVTFELCGDGSALEELKQECQQRGLDDIVSIHGRISIPALFAMYTRAHAIIVPTRSDIGEGLPMVVCEGILLNRPVITSRLSNAFDVLGSAIVETQADNVESYIQAIRHLMSDSAYYYSLSQNCAPMRNQFLDGNMGLSSVLKKALDYGKS